ncbi:hypothetical protein [Roseateles sp.]|jgi:hypothetical protein|uniref:hypothetical protein n=1 Tax=Roseateles sp. TaxID=1971397 RepID=UPI0037CACF95
MPHSSRLLLASLLALGAAAIHAAEPPEPKVERIVLEDDANRIEELKVRGQTQKVTVQPKNSKAPAYEIVMGDGSRELSAGPGSNRGTVGQRVWRVLSF